LPVHPAREAHGLQTTTTTTTTVTSLIFSWTKTTNLKMIMNMARLNVLFVLALSILVGVYASPRVTEHSASSDTGRPFVNTGVCVDATRTEVLQSIPTITTVDGKKEYVTLVPAVAIKDDVVFMSDSIYPVIQDVHLFLRGPPLFECEEHASLVEEMVLRTIDSSEGWQRGVRFIGFSGDFVVAAEDHWIHFLEKELSTESSSRESTPSSYKLVQSMELYPVDDFDCTPSAMAVVDGLVVVTYNNAGGLMFGQVGDEWSKFRHSIPPAGLAVAVPPSIANRYPSVLIYTTPWTNLDANTTLVMQLVCTTPGCEDASVGYTFDVPVNGMDMSVDPSSGTIAIGYPYSSTVEIYAPEQLHTSYRLVQTITGSYSFGKAVSFVGTSGTLLVSTPVDTRRESIEHAYENAGLNAPDCVFEDEYACEIPPPGTIEVYSMDALTMSFVATQTHSMIDPTYDLPFGIVISSSTDSYLFYTTAPSIPCAQGPVRSSVGAIYQLD